MAASQVQALLRFLSQDAKVPLATAMGKVSELRKADLTTYVWQQFWQAIFIGH
jgi:K+-sensing histidine kinase KdpD